MGHLKKGAARNGVTTLPNGVQIPFASVQSPLASMKRKKLVFTFYGGTPNESRPKHGYKNKVNTIDSNKEKFDL